MSGNSNALDSYKPLARIRAVSTCSICSNSLDLFYEMGMMDEKKIRDESIGSEIGNSIGIPVLRFLEF